MLSNDLPRELNGIAISGILAKLRHHMQLYGYKLLQLPVIDEADLFLVKAGDQIINTMFTFERQNKQFALRPEFTASAAHHFVKMENYAVARWQFAGSIFDDKFSNYEELGVGAELIGIRGSLADAEIIAMAAHGLEAIGIDNWKLTIGHIGLLRQILSHFQLDSRLQRYLLHHLSALRDSQKGVQWLIEQFDQQYTKARENLPTRITYSDQVSAMGGRTYDDIMARVSLKEKRASDRENFVTAVQFMYTWSQIEGFSTSTLERLRNIIPASDLASADLIQQWIALMSLVEAHGISPSRVTLDPLLIRDWEYYTGFVFEIYIDDVHVGGGGRYDELVRLVGAKREVPSVGFTYYGNRLLGQLNHEFFQETPCLILKTAENNITACIKWAAILRSKGLAVKINPEQEWISDNQQWAVVDSEDHLQLNERTFTTGDIDQLLNFLSKSV